MRTTTLSPAGCGLKVGGGPLVFAEDGLRAVPGPAIRIRDDLGKSEVGVPSLSGGRRLIQR